MYGNNLGCPFQNVPRYPLFDLEGFQRNYKFPRMKLLKPLWNCGRGSLTEVLLLNNSLKTFPTLAIIRVFLLLKTDDSVLKDWLIYSLKLYGLLSCIGALVRIKMFNVSSGFVLYLTRFFVQIYCNWIGKPRLTLANAEKRQGQTVHKIANEILPG